MHHERNRVREVNKWRKNGKLADWLSRVIFEDWKKHTQKHKHKQTWTYKVTGKRESNLWMIRTKCKEERAIESSKSKERDRSIDMIKQEYRSYFFISKAWQKPKAIQLISIISVLTGPFSQTKWTLRFKNQHSLCRDQNKW